MWSSRAGIRAQLLSLLQSTPNDNPRLRTRIVSLLGIFGDPELLPIFRALLLDTREEFGVRSCALRVGLSQGLHLAAHELSGLLEQALAQQYRGGGCLRNLVPFLEELLPLARTEEALRVAEAALLQMPLLDRADLLHRKYDEALLSPRLVDWWYAQWFDSDRQTLSESQRGRELNISVAIVTWRRPESWAYLTACAPELSASELERLLYRDIPREALVRLLTPHPKSLARAAEALLLPLPELLTRFGLDGLLRRLRRMVRRESLAHHMPYGWILGHPAGFNEAVELLVSLPEARPLLHRLLCDFGLHPETRRVLLAKYFERDRATVIRWALAGSAYPDQAPLVFFVLRRAATAPEPVDRPLFLAALRSADWLAVCAAISGLLGLDESGPGWCDRLTSLLQAPHPLVRLRAAAALVRQGRNDLLPLLRRTAQEALEPWLRAEALRRLGEVDAEASRPIFVRALEDQGTCSDRELAVDADEAAWALSRLGTYEDLSALLNGYLRGSWSYDIDEHLMFHLARQEGLPAEEVPLPLARG